MGFSAMLAEEWILNRHNAHQLQFRLTNKAKQKAISSTLEFQSAFVQADGSQNISTAESPGRCTSL